MTGRSLAVMFVDIVGFTEASSKQFRHELMGVIDKYQNAFQENINEFGGKLIKTTGDGCLATFESPTNALLCGLAIQQAVKCKLVLPNDLRFKVRVGISVGEVQMRRGDVFGEAVNLASRVESFTDPGEVYFTEAVWLSMNKNEVLSEYVGMPRFKGVPERTKVYRALSEGKKCTSRQAMALDIAKKTVKNKKMQVGVFLVASFFIFVASGVYSAKYLVIDEPQIIEHEKTIVVPTVLPASVEPIAEPTEIPAPTPRVIVITVTPAPTPTPEVRKLPKNRD